MSYGVGGSKVFLVHRTVQIVSTKEHGLHAAGVT